MATTTLKSFPTPSFVHEDSTHCLSGGRKEVTATVPASLLAPHKPDVSFVDEGGGLKCLAWTFVG